MVKGDEKETALILCLTKKMLCGYIPRNHSSLFVSFEGVFAFLH